MENLVSIQPQLDCWIGGGNPLDLGEDERTGDGDREGGGWEDSQEVET